MPTPAPLIPVPLRSKQAPLPTPPRQRSLLGGARRAIQAVFGLLALVLASSCLADGESQAPLGGSSAAALAAAEVSELAVAPSPSESASGGAPLTLNDAPRSLRAAALAAMQANAGPSYALTSSTRGGGAFLGELEAHGLWVELGEHGASLGRREAPDAPALSMRVRAAGCAGQTRQAQPALPDAEHNRVTYRHPLERGGELEAWYVTGPLGLEQGFTLREDWRCDGELELAVTVDGATVSPGRREGELTLTSNAGGERYTYGELYAHDATGRELPARMAPSPHGIVLRVDARGATYPVTVDPLVATQQAILVPAEADAPSFGFAVALSADTAIVGAPGTPTPSATGGGSAYVFVRSGSTWTQQAKLVVSDTTEHHRLGYQVTLSGDTALVSYGCGVGCAGEVAVFVRSGTSWTEQARLTASDAMARADFGNSIALSGDTALVGAWCHNMIQGQDDAGGAFNRCPGAAYVFVRTGTTWTQQAKFDSIGTNDYFGRSVALSGDTALVAAACFEEPPLPTGGAPMCAHVFQRTGDVWARQSKVTVQAGAPCRDRGSVV